MSFHSSKYFKIAKLENKSRKFRNDATIKYTNIAYGYLISEIYNKIIKHADKNKGNNLLEQDLWITGPQFIKTIGWNIESVDTNNLLLDIFHIFVFEGSMISRKQNGKCEFKLISGITQFSEEILEIIENHYPYFIRAVDEIIPYLTQSLELGKSAINRTSSNMALLWECLHYEGLLYNQVKENIKWDNKQLDKQIVDHTLTIANIGVGAGIDTIAVINKLLVENNNLKIIVYCFDESPILLNRAMDNLTIYKRQMGTELQNNNIELQLNFSQISFQESLGLPESSVDILISNYIIHFIPLNSRDQFFYRLTSLLRKTGILLITQMTSESLTLPHPLTLLYGPFKGFTGIPLYRDFKELGKKYFKDVKIDNMNDNWRLKRPNK